MASANELENESTSQIKEDSALESTYSIHLLVIPKKVHEAIENKEFELIKFIDELARPKKFTAEQDGTEKESKHKLKFHKKYKATMPSPAEFMNDIEMGEQDISDSSANCNTSIDMDYDIIDGSDNENNDEGEDIGELLDDTATHFSYKIVLYEYRTEGKENQKAAELKSARIDIEPVQQGQMQDFLIFFYNVKNETHVYALSTGRLYTVVKKMADISFPWKIARHVFSNIKYSKRRMLAPATEAVRISQWIKYGETFSNIFKSVTTGLKGEVKMNNLKQFKCKDTNLRMEMLLYSIKFPNGTFSFYKYSQLLEMLYKLSHKKSQSSSKFLALDCIQPISDQEKLEKLGIHLTELFEKGQFFLLHGSIDKFLLSDSYILKYRQKLIIPNRTIIPTPEEIVTSVTAFLEDPKKNNSNISPKEILETAQFTYGEKKVSLSQCLHIEPHDFNNIKVAYINGNWYEIFPKYEAVLRYCYLNSLNKYMKKSPLRMLPWDDNIMEGDYNLLYFEQLKLKPGQTKYFLLGDTILANKIELFDILFVTQEDTFIIHVKSGWEKETRTLIAQARASYELISLNGINTLKEYYFDVMKAADYNKMGTNDAKADNKSRLKKQLCELELKCSDFIKLFKAPRKVHVVCAIGKLGENDLYNDLPNHEARKITELKLMEEKISDPDIQSKLIEKELILEDGTIQERTFELTRMELYNILNEQCNDADTKKLLKLLLYRFNRNSTIAQRSFIELADYFSEENSVSFHLYIIPNSVTQAVDFLKRIALRSSVCQAHLQEVANSIAKAAATLKKAQNRLNEISDKVRGPTNKDLILHMKNNLNRNARKLIKALSDSSLENITKLANEFGHMYIQNGVSCTDSDLQTCIEEGQQQLLVISQKLHNAIPYLFSDEASRSMIRLFSTESLESN